MLDFLGLSRSVLPYIVFAVSLPVGLVAAVFVVTLVDARARAIREDTSVESALRGSREPIDMGHGPVPSLSGMGNRLLFAVVCLSVIVLMQILCDGTSIW
jgi:hypothetical protein